MLPRPHVSTRTDTLFPYPTLVRSFFQSLTAGGAVRYSDYDLFGSDWNYKGSVDWVINDSFRLRGTYGTGFRIPNVPELFGGVSEGNLTTTDPCSRYSTSGNATLIANCQASGVPRSEEHTSELQSLMRISYAVFCLKKK